MIAVLWFGSEEYVMDVLISTVGMSLISQLVGHAGPLTHTDGDIIIRYQYAQDVLPDLDDILTRAATHLRRHPHLVLRMAELHAIRTYVHRMTGRTQLILPNTDYIVLAPNTAIGRFCADHLKSVICAHIVNAYVTIVYIESVNPHNFDTLQSTWDALRTALDTIHKRYKSDVVYNVTGDYVLFSGLIHAYVSRLGARIIYACDADSPLVIVDANPSGTPADISFYQSDATAV